MEEMASARRAKAFGEEEDVWRGRAVAAGRQLGEEERRRRFGEEDAYWGGAAARRIASSSTAGE
uniref:Uncharacterized protein n=1 Tax=Oryza barthii TaxID=65489 RepID=A0A0D3FK35_9ORYZ